MSKSGLGGLVIGAMLLAGCTGMTDTQQRVTTGGLGGAGAGAVLGAIGGNAALGAAAGAAAGVVGGYIFDQHKKSEQAAYQRGVQDGSKSSRNY